MEVAALNMVITVVIVILITRQGGVGAGTGDRLPGLMGHVAPTLRVSQVVKQRD